MSLPISKFEPVHLISNSTLSSTTTHPKHDTNHPATTPHVLPLQRKETWAYYLLLSSYTPALLIGNFLIPNLVDAYGRQVGLLKNHLPCHTNPYETCYIPMGSYLMSTVEFSQLTLAISSLLQGLILIPLSSLADLENYRKYLMLCCILLGSIGFILPVINWDNHGLLITSILAVVGSFSISGMGSFSLSLIPFYSKIQAQVLSSTPEEYVKISEQSALELTTKGGALSLISTTIICSLGSTFNYVLNQSSLGLRLSILLGGIWWLIIGLLGWSFLTNRTGNSLVKGQNVVIYSLSCLKETTGVCFKSKPLLLTLISFFLISEGTNASGTITFMVALEELNVAYSTLSLVAFLLPLSCALGTFVFSIIQSKLNFCVKNGMIAMTILTSIIGSSNVIGLYNDKIGIRSEAEVIIAYVVSSFFFGPVLVIFRALLADLAPKGRECQIYTFITLLSSGSTWIGVLLVLAIKNYFLTPRYAGYMSSLLTLMGAGVLCLVDVDKGREQARNQAVHTKL